MDENLLVVLTVTYGDRADLLRETASSALDAPDTHLVIVSNGGSEATLSIIVELSRTHPDRVTSIRFPANIGSAPAFGAGLRASYAFDAPILILDDDNPVSPDKFARLRELAAYAPHGEPIAIAIHRPINDSQRAILAGEPADWVFRELRPGAFHGLDVFASRPRTGQIRRDEVRWGTAGNEQILYPLRATMWGGLYLSRAGVRLGALPLDDLVLYCDDNDFSREFNARGGSILLTDLISIEDTAAWRPAPARTGWRRRLPATVFTDATDAWRLQYLFRNQAYVSRRQARGDALATMRLAVNATVRISAYAALALLAGRPRLGLSLTSASIAGLRGRLGRSYPLPG